MRNLLRPRVKRSGAIQSTANAFEFTGGGTIPTPNSWGKWLQNQDAPVFKQGHRLHYLTVYTAWGDQEYEIAIDECERWGYALNVGADQVRNFYEDALLNPPPNDRAKVLRTVLDNPTRYPISMGIRQYYPNEVEAPGGWLSDANGVVFTNPSGWSPEPTPAAMQRAVDDRLANLRWLKGFGVNIVQVYDGGEFGLGTVGENPEARFGRDPKVVAAKGSKSWKQYIDERQGVILKTFADAVAAEVPNRQNFGYYPCVGNPYANIIGADAYSWDYSQVKVAGDRPCGSVYYRDYFATTPAMMNPLVNYANSYYDTLTHWLSAVSTQITDYNQQLSYNFVSAGWRHSQGLGVEPGWFVSIESYTGFLKCMYATGSLGNVAGYFDYSCSRVGFGGVYYPKYDPLNPPHWLLQQTALGEVHARFSWLDEYILDGDLLPGLSNEKHPAKRNRPSFEFWGYQQKGNFFQRDLTARVFVRKLRNADKWLIVTAVADEADGRGGKDRMIWVRDIPGVEPLHLLARAGGCIYTVDRTGGDIKLKWEDAPKPNPNHIPVPRKARQLGTNRLSLEFYTTRWLNGFKTNPKSAYSIAGYTISDIEVKEETIYFDITPALPQNASIAINYTGDTLRDWDENIVTPFTFNYTTPTDYFTTRNSVIAYDYYAYKTLVGSGANFNGVSAVSTLRMLGDGEIYAKYTGDGNILGLSAASNNTGYAAWEYALYGGTVNNEERLAAFATGQAVNIGFEGAPYYSSPYRGEIKLSREGTSVKGWYRPTNTDTWVLLTTFTAPNSQPLYAHFELGVDKCVLFDFVLTGFTA